MQHPPIHPVAKPIVANSSKRDFPKEFSIITLVNDGTHYSEMVESFISSGFDTETCEYIYLDNLKSNQWEAYNGLNFGISNASGKHHILCHQDVRLDFDKIDVLRSRINEISKKDPNWGVLGNAGGSLNPNQTYLRITDPTTSNAKVGRLPAKVMSLDENFLLLKASKRLAFSTDLLGFHFYGTDICQQAMFRGMNSYVIDFHLRHLSSGNRNDDFWKLKKDFIESYRKKLADRFIRTTVSRLYLSESKFKSQLFNKPFAMKFLRKTGLYKFFQ
ncbi:MAG: acyl esterase [Opitutae bacterium]|nr:acyl esterase [Opitutae bacterium]